MIIKTAEELGEAYWNCMSTSPLGKDRLFSPRQMGSWWREQGVYPQRDGRYAFNTEEEFTWFLLKWS